MRILGGHEVKVERNYSSDSVKFVFEKNFTLSDEEARFYNKFSKNYMKGFGHIERDLIDFHTLYFRMEDSIENDKYIVEGYPLEQKETEFYNQVMIIYNGFKRYIYVEKKEPLKADNEPKIEIMYK
jgi:hypothetical protein